MTGIVIRIPTDIRKYKERIVFGLSVRQLICTVIALAVCVPLYFFGRGYITDDILSWAILIVALPLLAMGFVTINNLPMEKYIVEWLKFELLYPARRRFTSSNAFSLINNMAIKDDLPKSRRGRKKLNRYRYQAGLERAALMVEASEKGVEGFNADKADLLTVSEPKSGGGGGGNWKKPKKDKKKDNGGGKGVSKLKRDAEAVLQKQLDDPQYVPTNKERKTLQLWHKQQTDLRVKELTRKKKEAQANSAKMKKRKKAKTSIPRSTQQSIPYIADYGEGMFEVTQNRFSKIYRITDINYSKSKYEERESIFISLGEFYNFFSDTMTFAVTVDNRYVSMSEQERKIFNKMTGDSYDKHRVEYNRVLGKQILIGRNDMHVDKILTVTIDADVPYEALLRFRRLDNDIRDHLRKFGSDVRPLSSTERLAYYHDKYRRGHEGEFKIDFDFLRAQGLCSKDYIAPSYFHFDRNHIQIDDDFYRVMYLSNLPQTLSDEFFCTFCDNEFATTSTISVMPMAQDKAMRFVKKRLTGIETNKFEAEKNLARQGLSPEHVRRDIMDAYTRGLELHDDILNKDQRLFFVTITVMVHGRTLEELDYNCKTLEGKAGTVAAQLRKLTTQQEEGYKVTFPFGYFPRNIKVDTTLTTDSLSVFMPFKNTELFQSGGFYYGLNQISNNLIVLDRTAMKTPSGFVLGTSGSGKSFATKREILNVLLNSPDTGILIIDPENEYGDFCRAFGGTVIKISADSTNYINPMDMSEDYGLDEEDSPDLPIAVKIDKAWRKKSDFIMSIVERMISVGGNADSSSITAPQRTIIDRCVKRCYKEYFDHHFDEKYLPTLKNLQDELDKERNSEDGKQIAEGVEYYTRGSMSFLANKTNVEINNRMVVFNVRDLGEQLRQIALSIVFDFIWNRMVENKNRGVRTYCYCDEIHVMFRSYYTSFFLQQLYKRGRKYGLCITGLTQNVSDLLSSEMARGMIGNSDYIMMLNQHSEDLKLLAAMLSISEAQLPYVMGADAGSGLLFAENVIVPFIDRFPTDSYLYKLMSTKFGEDMSADEVDKQIKSLVNSQQ